MSRIQALVATLIFGLSLGSVSWAQEGFAPGEPDPNLAPGKEMNDPNETVLLDDRKPCPKGKKRFQKMQCGVSGESPKCDHYSVVLECLPKAKVLHCKKPQIPVPVYQCEP
ncbi:MAG: hypothetical protein AB1540_10560 [Bdellovibrionota bacterium]